MAKRVMSRLGMLESAKLLAYVERHYTEENTTDKNFAAKASEALGFPVLENHVETRRKALDIPANAPQRAPTLEAMFELVRELEQRIAKLEVANERTHT